MGCRRADFPRESLWDGLFCADASCIGVFCLWPCLSLMSGWALRLLRGGEDTGKPQQHRRNLERQRRRHAFSQQRNRIDAQCEVVCVLVSHAFALQQQIPLLSQKKSTTRSSRSNRITRSCLLFEIKPGEKQCRIPYTYTTPPAVYLSPQLRCARYAVFYSNDAVHPPTALI